VDQINQMGATLQQINGDRRRNSQDDAGLDTRMQTVLEQLSELVSFTPLFQADGTVTILIGGQSALVVGENLYPISVSSDMPTDPLPLYDGAPAPSRLFSPSGAEITGLVTGGRLAGLIQVRNEVLPSLSGNAYHTGDLNELAKSIADRVNEILTSSLISAGPPPVSGVPMFTYDATSPATVAHTIGLDAGITAAGLASISPGPPQVINGAALQLANLANPQEDADKIGGSSYVAFYGLMSGRVGRLLSDARENQDYRSQMTVQARNLRGELSAVSLDEEATLVISFQRAYQANSQMVVILNELIGSVIDMLR
jgi:flagellar hook-associated protein 1 FlgK